MFVEYGSLQPCPNCGAHRWTRDIRLWERDMVRCGECNREERCQDLQYPPVGGD